MRIFGDYLNSSAKFPDSTAPLFTTPYLLSSDKRGLYLADRPPLPGVPLLAVMHRSPPRRDPAVRVPTVRLLVVIELFGHR